MPRLHTSAAVTLLMVSFALNGQSLMEWHHSLGGSNTDRPKQVASTPDGGGLVVGHTSSDDLDFGVGLGGADGIVLKLDSSGEVAWFNRYGGSEDDSLNDIIALSDGSCIVVGSSESADGDLSSNHGGQDFWNLPRPLPFELYPNPAADQLTIRSQDSIECVELFDAMGRILRREQVSNKVHLLDVSELNRGVYSLRATRMTGAVHTQRFVLR